MMKVKFMSALFCLITILDMFCSPAESIHFNTEDLSDDKLKNLREEDTLKEASEIRAKAKTYLDALSIFDLTSNRSFGNSCARLAKSIKPIISPVKDFEREYSAPLFVYPSWKPEIFPEVYFRFFPFGTSPKDKTDIDVVIRRKDGTLFAFESYLSFGHATAAGILYRIGTKNVSGWFLRGLKKPITHTVVIGIEFLQDAIRFSFLRERQDQTQPLVVEVVRTS
nr:PREDICTED: uncharacterized protein LOC109037497 [Bemisia tabaci]